MESAKRLIQPPSFDEPIHQMNAFSFTAGAITGLQHLDAAGSLCQMLLH
jgi:hypothetical protein